MEKTNETIDREDYRNGDGLLVCGRCGTPKEMRLSMEALGGHTAIVPIPCECMKRAEQERRERELAAERKRRTERMRAECFEGRRGRLSSAAQSTPRCSALACST